MKNNYGKCKLKNTFHYYIVVLDLSVYKSTVGIPEQGTEYFQN